MGQTFGTGEQPTNEILVLQSGLGDLDSVNLIFSHKKNVPVDPNWATPTTGVTALHAAAKNGYLKVCQVLIDEGAEVNQEDVNGCTAVHYAVAAGHMDILTFLIEKGGDITKVRLDGSMAIHDAAVNGHVEMLEFLLSKGSEVSPTNVEGKTPLHLAAEGGHTAAAKYLAGLDGVDPNAVTNNGETPIAIAAGRRLSHIGVDISQRNYEMVKTLYAFGADEKLKDKDGCDAMMRAATIGNTAVVHFLAGQGVSVNVPSADGWLPIHRAVTEGKEETVHILLHHGAKLDVRTPATNRLPIDMATTDGMRKILQDEIDKRQRKKEEEEAEKEGEEDQPKLCWPFNIGMIAHRPAHVVNNDKSPVVPTKK